MAQNGFAGHNGPYGDITKGITEVGILFSAWDTKSVSHLHTLKFFLNGICSIPWLKTDMLLLLPRYPSLLRGTRITCLRFTIKITPMSSWLVPQEFLVTISDLMICTAANRQYVSD